MNSYKEVEANPSLSTFPRCLYVCAVGKDLQFHGLLFL